MPPAPRTGSPAGSPAGSPVLVVRIGEDDWERVRDIRLEMLADTPTAYLETLEQARERPEAGWRARARSAAGPDSLGVAALDPATGRWVGTMGAFTAPGEDPLLVGVYVSPAARGTGAADALLDAVEAWARRRGARSLYLEVHEHNARAQAFYLRRGFAFTGSSVPYPLDGTARELQMVRALG